MSAVRNVLEDDFKETFGITEVIKDFQGGQKKVFIVKIGEKIQVLKIFIDYSKRDIRELEIYKKYKDNNFLPKIIDIKEYKGNTIVFEELIDGYTLEECKENYLLNEELVIQLLKDIIDVLDKLWIDEIVHRDIKPSNIIITENKPYVIDFGIAKNLNLSSLTETGFQPGTKRFMSPEQILGKNKLISYRSDFFSLGVLAYYLYYGKYPFGTDIEEITKMFSDGKVDYTLNKGVGINTFLDSVFNLQPHLRPRNTQILLKLFS